MSQEVQSLERGGEGSRVQSKYLLADCGSVWGNRDGVGNGIDLLGPRGVRGKRSQDTGEGDNRGAEKRIAGHRGIAKRKITKRVGQERCRSWAIRNDLWLKGGGKRGDGGGSKSLDMVKTVADGMGGRWLGNRG